MPQCTPTQHNNKKRTKNKKIKSKGIIIFLMEKRLLFIIIAVRWYIVTFIKIITIYHT
jgi:hypothetical protein